MTYREVKLTMSSDLQAGRDIANACQAFGSGLFGAEAGQNAQFMIQSYSGSGDMLDGGGK